MIVFPNAKINIGLQVLHRRPDGFHELATVFYPVALQDGLEVVSSPANDTVLTSSGLSIDAPPGDNICMKAYELLRRDHPQLPAVRIHLHKVIPSGAGLGGGSSDAAFLLRLLDRKYRLGLSGDQLKAYALQLGSDCPFFLVNQPAFATGRGEELQPVTLDLSSYSIVLINPRIHVPTSWAFGQLQPRRASVSLAEAIQRPVNEWRDVIVNDFEQPVFAAHPEIGAIKEKLYEQGALYASMSGSGSTVYGIFRPEAAPVAGLPDSYFKARI